MDKNENKDKLIQSVFDDYIDGIQPSNMSLEAATAFLHAHNFQQRKDKAAKKRPLKKRVMAIAALCLAGVMLFSYLLYSFNQLILSRPKYYSAQSLSSVTISASDVSQIQSQLGLQSNLFPNLGEDYDTKYRLYYFTEQSTPAFIKAKSRFSLDGSMVDIIITAEFTKDILDEKREFFNLPASEVAGIKVNHREVFENGEYITSAALKHNDIKYYLEIMSPSSHEIEAYASLILDL